MIASQPVRHGAHFDELTSSGNHILYVSDIAESQWTHFGCHHGGVAGQQQGKPSKLCPPEGTEAITISGKLGDDAKHYQVRAVRVALKELEQ